MAVQKSKKSKYLKYKKFLTKFPKKFNFRNEKLKYFFKKIRFLF